MTIRDIGTNISTAVLDTNVSMSGEDVTSWLAIGLIVSFFISILFAN